MYSPDYREEGRGETIRLSYPPSHCGQLYRKHLYPWWGRPSRKSKKLEKTFLMDSMAKDNTEREQKGTGSQTQEGALAVFTAGPCLGQPLLHCPLHPQPDSSPQDCAHNPPGLSLLHYLLSCQLPPPTRGFTVQEHTYLEVRRHTEGTVSSGSLPQAYLPSQGRGHSRIESNLEVDRF